MSMSTNGRGAFAWGSICLVCPSAPPTPCALLRTQRVLDGLQDADSSVRRGEHASRTTQDQSSHALDAASEADRPGLNSDSHRLSRE